MYEYTTYFLLMKISIDFSNIQKSHQEQILLTFDNKIVIHKKNLKFIKLKFAFKNILLLRVSNDRKTAKI